MEVFVDYLNELFIQILNMGITTIYVVMAVLIIRFCIRKAPKIFSYGLWAVVGFRLVCPISYSSVLSIFNLFHTNTKSSNTRTMNFIPSYSRSLTTQNDVMETVTHTVNNNLPTGTLVARVDPMQIVITIAMLVWIIGIASLLIYSTISYIRLKNRMSKAVLMKDNIYECDDIPSPFVMGILKPRIYIPFHLNVQELSYIIMHEKYHIKRFDYIIKPFAFLLLTLHWFNPFIWIAYLCMCKDMEMSCDEKVISDMGTTVKSDYSISLLAFATNHKLPVGPLTFGETNTKSRIKNILMFNKPKAWLTIVIGVICFVAIIVCATNPATKSESSEDKSSNSEVVTGTSENARYIYSCKNTYIGDNSADGKLLNAIGVGDNLGSFTMELETSETPYILRLNFNDLVVNRDMFDNKMCDYAAVLLALIGNADEIQWSYPYNQDGELVRITVYWNNQNLIVMGIDDIKSYGQSADKVQELLDYLDNDNSDIDLSYADNVTDDNDGKPQDGTILTMNDILEQKDWNSLTLDYYKAFDNAEQEDIEDKNALNVNIKFILSYGDDIYELQVSYMKEGNSIDSILLVKQSDSDAILLYSDNPVYEVNTDVKAFLKKKVTMSQFLTYQLPDSLMDGNYSAVLGVDGGNLFLKDSQQPEGPEYAPVEWYAYGGVYKLPYEKANSDTDDYSPQYVTFENGKLVNGSIGENHTEYIGEPIILEGLKAQAVIMEVMHDLYTAAGVGAAEEAGNPIPVDEQTSKMYEIFFAREDGNAAYCIFLNQKYFTYEDTVALAKSVQFKENAFE